MLRYEKIEHKEEASHERGPDGKPKRYTPPPSYDAYLGSVRVAMLTNLARATNETKANWWRAFFYGQYKDAVCLECDGLDETKAKLEAHVAGWLDQLGVAVKA